MEQTVTRLRFRLAGRGTTIETEGRIVHNPEGTHVMQVGYSSPEHAHILLEVGPVSAESKLWPLFRRLCEYRNLLATEYRTVGPRGPGDWQPVPGGDEPAAGASAPTGGKKKK